MIVVTKFFLLSALVIPVRRYLAPPDVSRERTSYQNQFSYRATAQFPPWIRPWREERKREGDSRDREAAIAKERGGNQNEDGG